jgi:hypothetical protein
MLFTMRAYKISKYIVGDPAYINLAQVSASQLDQ